MNGKIIDRIRILALLFAATLAAGNATAADQQPTVRADSGFTSERVEDDRRDLSESMPTVAEKKTSTSSDKSSGVAAQSADCCGHYVYSGNTELYDDFDHDGFYSFLRVTVDIDTDFAASDLFIEVYLRGSTGDWVRIFESDVFTINGTSAFDDYEVDSELVSGFVPDYYDVLVEVYDAYSGEWVASYGPLDDPAFSLLPLEDVNRDAVVVEETIVHAHGSGGGSLSVAGLLMLAALYVLRRRSLQSARANRNLS